MQIDNPLPQGITDQFIGLSPNGEFNHERPILENITIVTKRLKSTKFCMFFYYALFNLYISKYLDLIF